MDRRTRVCVWIIMLGLANLAAYTVGLISVGGESMNGYVRRDTTDGGRVRYFMEPAGGEVFEVSGGVWLYSAIHSISLPLTVGAILLAMLTLAKDRLVATMHSTIVRGRAFITLLAAAFALISAIGAAYFTCYTIKQLADPPVLGALSIHAIGF